MTLGERIVFYRKEAGISQKELAEELGITATRLNYWEKDKREPDVQMINALCKVLRINGDMLLGRTASNASVFSPQEIEFIKKYRNLNDRGKKTVNYILDNELEHMNQLQAFYDSSKKNQPKLLPLRRSLQYASAGTGTYIGPEEFETIYVEENDLTSRAAFIIPVRGDSMEPIYHDGDQLLVEKAEDVNIGEIGIFTVDGDGYVKKRGDGVLISLNANYPPVQITEDSWCNGRVIGILKPEWIG